MSRRPPFRAARVAAIAALTVGCASMLVAGPASGAADPGADPDVEESVPGASEEVEPELVTFGLSSATDGAPDDRPYLEMVAGPGSTIYEQVAVLNQSDVPLDLELYAADAMNTANGAVALPSRDVTPTDAGSWITLGASSVRVQPQSSSGIGFTMVPVTITIPVDAEPGDHLAGVLTSLTTVATAAGEGTSANVDLVQRVGLRVYVTVSGDTHAGLTITDVQTTYHQADLRGLAVPGSATVTYTLTNTGNTRLNVQATSTASGLFGLGEVSAAGATIEELLPKSSVTQTVELADVWPTILQKVTVTASATAPFADDDPGIDAPAVSVWMWAVPWAYLAILLLLATGWWLRRRRKAAGRPKQGRGRRASTPAGPSGPAHLAEEAKHPQTVP